MTETRCKFAGVSLRLALRGKLDDNFQDAFFTVHWSGSAVPACLMAIQDSRGGSLLTMGANVTVQNSSHLILEVPPFFHFILVKELVYSKKFKTKYLIVFKSNNVIHFLKLPAQV